MHACSLPDASRAPGKVCMCEFSARERVSTRRTDRGAAHCRRPGFLAPSERVLSSVFVRCRNLTRFRHLSFSWTPVRSFLHAVCSCVVGQGFVTTPVNFMECYTDDVRW